MTTTGGSGGPLTDRTSVAYTNSAGTSSVGHIYAGGLDWSKTVGVLVYADGSAEYGLKNPGSTYLLAGTNGLIAVAKRQNMVLVTPLAPGAGCDDGDGTCWYDSSGSMSIATKTKWCDDFIKNQVLLRYNIDKTRVCIAGYSSGAENTMAFYGPGYASAWVEGGLLLAISYGSRPWVTPTFTAGFKANVAAVWDIGSADTTGALTDGLEGFQWYQANGFATTEWNVVSGVTHDRDGTFGAIVDREVTQHVPAATAAGSGAGFTVSAGPDLQRTPGAAVAITATETGTPGAAVASRVWTLGGAPATTADQTVAAERYGWGQPAASDEMNYSGAPNPSKWGVYNGPGHDGNGLRSPSQVTVNGSAMVLSGAAGSANTAGLEHKYSQKYGRWEVRCRSSVTGTGSDDYHVVLILWPDDDDTYPWPRGGEIDFLEVDTPGAADAEAYWHYPSLDGNNSQLHFSKSGVDLTQWHNFAVEQSSAGLVGYIDGVEWCRASGGATSKRRAIQDPPGPMHLTVQLDAFSASGMRAGKMEVDWVRAYPIVAQGQTSTGGGTVGQTIGSAAALSWTAPATAGVYTLTYSALDASGNVLGSDSVNVEVVTTPAVGGTGGGSGGSSGGGVPLGTALVIEPDPILSTEAFGTPTLVFDTSVLPEVPTFPGNATWPGPTTFPRGSLDPRFLRQRTGWTLYPGPAVYPGAGTWPGWGIADEAPPPYGVEFFLLDGAAGGYRCELPDVKSFTLTDVANSVWSVSVDYPADGLNFDLLREHVDSGVDATVAVRFAGSSEWERQVVLSECDSDDVAETGVWQFRGGGSVLDEAAVYPDPGATDGKVGFVDATPGAIVTELAARAQERGGFDVDTSTFSGAYDSHGLAWSTDLVSSPSFAPGDASTYTRVLQLLADAGLCEFELRGRSLRLYAPGGRGFDRTVGTPVVLQGGRDLLEASRRYSVRSAVTSLLVLGSDGDWTEVADDTALGRRGRRVEGVVSQGSLSGGALRAYGAAKLATATTAQVERVHKLAVVDGSPLPVRDFDIGDLVWSDADGTRRRLRVAQWTLTLDDQGLSGSVSLGDLIDDPLLKLARRLLGISDGSTVTGGTSGPQAVQGLTPGAPTGLAVESVTAPQPDGSSLATLLVSWDPVILAADGISGVDVTGYRLRWRYTLAAGAGVPVPLAGEWTLRDDLDTATSAQIEGVIPDAQVEVQVGAYSIVTTTITPPDDTGGSTGGDTGGDTGGSGGGGTPPEPVGTTIPAILRMGKASGLTKANLGVDFLSGDGPSGNQGKHVDYDLAAIEAGLGSEVVPKYAQVRPDGAVRLTSFVGGATTPNSTHSRTEFRELALDGVAKAAWSSKAGRHYVWCRGAIIKLPAGRQRACIAQAHTPDDDLCMILVDQGSNVESTYGDTGRPGRLTSSLVLGQVHEWMIELVREDSQTVINYYWDDMTTPKAVQPYAGGDGLYFKFGNYQQSSTQYDSVGETCIVDLYDCEVWHTGAPTPPARHAAGSSGGSTGGSTGGATGGSTGGTPDVPVGQTTKMTEGFSGTLSSTLWSSVQTHTYPDGTSVSSYGTGSDYRLKINYNAGTDHPSVLRTEIHDGDTAVGSHERSEISSFGKSWNDNQNDECWYEFDVRFGDPSWSPSWSSSDDWLIFFQWHHPGSSDDAPPLALSVHNDNKVYFEREANDVIQSFLPVWTVRPGQWEHVVIHVKWSPSASTGFVHAYVNGVETVPKTFCATQHSDDTSNYYAKLGQYRRSSVSGTTVVMHDNLRVSSPPAG